MYYDFQGWPVYKMTIREILEALGIEKISNRSVDYWQISDNDPILDQYPKIFHDDGVGYSPTTEYICDAYKQDADVILWADKKQTVTEQ